MQIQNQSQAKGYQGINNQAARKNPNFGAYIVSPKDLNLVPLRLTKQHELSTILPKKFCKQVSNLIGKGKLLILDGTEMEVEKIQECKKIRKKLAAVKALIADAARLEGDKVIKAPDKALDNAVFHSEISTSRLSAEDLAEYRTPWRYFPANPPKLSPFESNTILANAKPEQLPDFYGKGADGTPYYR